MRIFNGNATSGKVEVDIQHAIQSIAIRGTQNSGTSIGSYYDVFREHCVSIIIFNRKSHEKVVVNKIPLAVLAEMSTYGEGHNELQPNADVQGGGYGHFIGFVDIGNAGNIILEDNEYIKVIVDGCYSGVNYEIITLEVPEFTREVMHVSACSVPEGELTREFNLNGVDYLMIQERSDLFGSTPVPNNLNYVQLFFADSELKSCSYHQVDLHMIVRKTNDIVCMTTNTGLSDLESGSVIQDRGQFAILPCQRSHKATVYKNDSAGLSFYMVSYKELV